MMDSKPILEAIASRRFLEVTYNRMRMKVAPHVLYTRHGDLFLDAVPVEREGKSLVDPRMSTFKLAGLDIGQILKTSFVPLPAFDPSDAKYTETTPSFVA